MAYQLRHRTERCGNSRGKACDYRATSRLYHGPEARRPGVRRPRRSAANQRRVSVSGNRATKAAHAL